MSSRHRSADDGVDSDAPRLKEKLALTLVIAATLGMFVACVVRVGWFSSKPLELPDVEIWLSEPVETMKGHDWLVMSNGELSSLSGTADDSRVTIHMPDAHSLTTVSTTLHMKQENGQVILVSLTPRPETEDARRRNPFAFSEAIAEVEQLLGALDVDNAPAVRDRISEWKRESPTAGVGAPDFLASALLTGSFIEFQIKSYVSGQGWYVVVSFYDRSHYNFLSAPSNGQGASASEDDPNLDP